MSDIIVKFKPDGQKGLVTAIKAIQKAQDDLTGVGKKYNVVVAKQTAKVKALGISWKSLGISAQTLGKAAKGSRVDLEKLNLALKGVRLSTKKATTATDKHRLAIGRNRKAMSSFEQSFATIRSRLLVYNFLMGLGVRQTIEFSRQAARVQDMSRAFTTLSGTGENAALSVNKISNAVKGTMSQMDLFKQANNAMILGVTRNTDEMAEMFQIAQTLGAALGVDTAHAVESLITGIGRQSRLMLDNIGIIVKSEEAYESYAKELGVTKDELTDAQKKQAFFTATMESARAKAAELGNQQLTARDQFNQFNATMEDFTNFIGDKTTPVVLSFFNSFGETLKRITETDIETAVRQLKDLGAEAEQLSIFAKILEEQRAREQIEKSEKIIIDGFKNIALQLQDDPIGGFSFLTSETLDKMIVDLEKFGLDVEKNMVSAGRAGALMVDGLNISMSDLNIDAINQEIKDLEFNAETLRFLLSQSPKNQFFLEQLNEGHKLHTLYKLIIQEYENINKANEKLNGTNEKLTESEKAKAAAAAKTAKAAADAKLAAELKAKALEEEIKLNKKLLDSSFALGKGYKNAADAAVAGAKSVIVAKIQEAVITYMAEAMTKIPFPLSLGVPALGAAMAAALGSVLSGSSSNVSNSVGGGSTFGKFEQGGYVGGNRHSQGGTIIEAERGEFVMSRNAVESIGLETLNQMNQSGGGGNINVNVSGNVLTQDFVEGELAESIKEAVRRGSDFGIG